MRLILPIFALLACALPAIAQTDLTLGGIDADPTAPVEVTAENLSVDQDTGRAVFSGDVVIGQGELRIAAGRVEVIYDADSGDIARLLASDGVTFVTASEAAEAQSADYDLTGQTLLLRGDVLLTQGNNAISAQEMSVDLDSGNATMTGRVRTVLQQGGN